MRLTHFHHHRRGPVALPWLLTLVLCAPGLAHAAVASTQGLDHVVAIVNDESITSYELGLRIKAAELQLERQKIAMPGPDVLRAQVLERMIVDRAQVQMAKENGVRVDDVTVNAAIQRMADQNKITVTQMREQVEAEGIPFTRFREEIRDDVAMQRLREHEVDARIQVSEAEVDDFLEKQEREGAAAVEYDLAQILLRVPENASPERIEEVRKRAEDLRAQALAGNDFAKLAASYSAGSEALKGGDLGFRPLDRLPQLFVDAIKGQPDGAIMPVVRSPGGFHVLKLVARRGASDAQAEPSHSTRTHVRHILIRSGEGQSDVEAQHRLEDLRGRIVDGKQDFGQIARLHSMDGSSTRGGDLGWVFPGDLVPDFERAMNALKIDEVSQVVKSPFGYHLIQVLERRDDENPQERKRAAARQALRERRSEEATLEWMRQLRDRTYVELRDD